MAQKDRAYSTADWRASERRDEYRQPTVQSQPPVIEVWKCPTCYGAWTEAGSYTLGRCTRCGTERP